MQRVEKYRTFITILLFFSPFFLWSQSQGLIDTSEKGYLGTSQVYVFIDSTNQLGIEQVDDPERVSKFKKIEKEDLNFGFEHNNIWLRLQIEKPYLDEEFFLVEYLTSLDYIQFFYSDSLGIWQMEETGDRLAYENRAIKNRFFVFPLVFPKQVNSSTFYLKVQTTGSAQIPLRILNESELHQETLQGEMGYGFFYGMLGVMFLYNLFLYFSLKDKSFLFYLSNVLATFLLMGCVAGHQNVFLVSNNPELANYMIPFFSAFSLLTNSAFFWVFLRVEKYIGQWKYIVYAQWAAAILLMGATWFFHYGVVQKIVGIVGSLAAVINVLIAVLIWRKGNPSAKFYFFAFGAYGIGVLVVVLRNMGLMALNTLTLHSIEIGASIELILLSLALSDRYNRYRKEKEAATKLALEVQKEANETLESKVQERTIQLRAANNTLNNTVDKLNSTLHLVEKERKKSDKLLLNILPADTAQELKETGTSVPRHYKQVTVLFTDFKDFTSLSQNMPPEEVVENLSTCFLAFDEICQKYGLEKIKTIGDSYMCVGGVPLPNESNPVDAVRAGLAMQAWIKEWAPQKITKGERPWYVRIGIHTGEVVAGIVGKDKFAYDVWGDTVNLASRMERRGEIGKINVSETTYQCVKTQFSCAFRGNVQVKNRGEVKMYFVEELG